MDEKDTNRLIHETSPYLLQHAHNPVEWYPWGEEALSKARKEEKPILLSVGYSACHWCHVMERECFENEDIASIMNEHFVNIKVDREERPDIDQIYQTAAQLLTGQGGWPLTIFLTPDHRPFYAGTYFPPDDRFGRPGFPRVLQSLIRTYREEPDRIERAASQLTEALRQVDRRDLDERAEIPPEEGDRLLEKATAWLASHADEENGGFGSQPKFPNSTVIEVLLRYCGRQSKDREKYRDVITLTLDKMATGGIYDHVGGGFHRYATDAAWLIPHFEKMLYDNALLSVVYLQGYQMTGNERYAQVVRETLRYVQREMSHPEGGFYSTQDADSEGEEGKYFVWRPEEFQEVLGDEDARLVADYFGVTERGNFEGGTTVLHIAQPLETVAGRYDLSPEEGARRIAEARRRLLEARERRVKPDRDEKVIAGWSSLMLSAFAKAHQVLRDETYLSRAVEAKQFISAKLVADGRLVRSYKGRAASIPGYLDDYAYWVQALLDLYEASLDRTYLEEANRWMLVCLDLFWDSDSPGFFFTPAEHEALIHRPKNWRDQSVPSGTGISVQNILRLHSAFEEEGYEEKARQVLETYRRQLDQNPWGTASILLAYDTAVNGSTEVVIVAEEGEREKVTPLAKVLGDIYVPAQVVHVISPEEARGNDAPSLWRGKERRQERVTAYVCRGYTCSPPVTEPTELRDVLGE